MSEYLNGANNEIFSDTNNMEITLTERYDLNNMVRIMNSNLIDHEWKSRMGKYKKHSKDGAIKVKYIKNDIGRLEIKAQGLKKGETLTTASCMKGVCKSALFSRDYVDLDVVNAHPEILHQIYVEKGYKCDVVSYYVKNRDKFFKKCEKYKMDRQMVKVLVCRLFYGGSTECFRKEHPKLEVPKFFDEMEQEVKVNRRKLLNLNELLPYRMKAIEDKGESYHNVEGTALSYYLQTIECEVLLSMYNYLISSGWRVGSLIHDGLHLEKPDVIGEDDDEVAERQQELYDKMIPKVEKVIKEKTGYTLKVKIKPFEVLDELMNIQIVESDKEAGIYLTEKLKNDYVICKERTFMRINDLWTSNDKEIRRGLIKAVSNTDIIMNENAYSKMNKGCNNIMPFIEPTEDDDFIDNLWSSNIGKLCFKNGYWDFAEWKLKPYDNDVSTCIKINRDYEPSTEAMRKEVYDRVFIPIFNKDTECMKCWLNYVARGLAGHVEDKNWAVCMGERDCGKGVLGGALENAFGDYVRATNSENFLYKHNGADSAKALSWLVPFEFKRLLLTNEITKDSEGKVRINGNILKKLASGGDKIEARVNHKDEINFKIQARPVMFCNDLPDIQPSDAKETAYMFRHPSKFVPKGDVRLEKPVMRQKYSTITIDGDDEIVYEKDEQGNPIMINVCKFYLKDDTIKSWLKRKDVLNAFIDILFENYGEKVELPESMKEDQEDFKDEITDESRFYELFNFEDDEMWDGDKGWCSIEQINFVLRKAGITASPQKYRSWLQKKGCCKCKRKDEKSGKRVNCWLGIELNAGKKQQLEDEGCLMDDD